MYSPKIREDLVSRLYQLAKQQGKTMTAVVNAMIEKQLVQDNATASAEILCVSEKTTNGYMSSQPKKRSRGANLNA